MPHKSLYLKKITEISEGTYQMKTNSKEIQRTWLNLYATADLKHFPRGPGWWEQKVLLMLWQSMQLLVDDFFFVPSQADHFSIAVFLFVVKNRNKRSGVHFNDFSEVLRFHRNKYSKLCWYLYCISCDKISVINKLSNKGEISMEIPYFF